MPLNEQPAIPRQGWRLVSVTDLCLDEGRARTAYENCEYCGQERIRYVHCLEHPVSPVPRMRVGCLCAGHLTGDAETSRRRETELRNRAARRAAWTKRDWKPSAKGNRYLVTADDHHIVVYPARGGYMLVIDGKPGRKVYPAQKAAQLAAFDYLYIPRK
jgi:hypothetical protein